MSFPERFRELVASSGLTQKELANALGLSEGAIVNYKRDRVPKADELVAIANHFGITVDWLLRGTEPPGRDASADAWKSRALAAEKKLDAIKAAMRTWLEKI
jgi:transcriptional regulator with XRE-family HTH domain